MTTLYTATLKICLLNPDLSQVSPSLHIWLAICGMEGRVGDWSLFYLFWNTFYPSCNHVFAQQDGRGMRWKVAILRTWGGRQTFTLNLFSGGGLQIGHPHWEKEGPRRRRKWQKHSKRWSDFSMSMNFEDFTCGSPLSYLQCPLAWTGDAECATLAKGKSEEGCNSLRDIKRREREEERSRGTICA